MNSKNILTLVLVYRRLRIRRARPGLADLTRCSAFIRRKVKHRSQHYGARRAIAQPRRQLRQGGGSSRRSTSTTSRARCLAKGRSDCQSSGKKRHEGEEEREHFVQETYSSMCEFQSL